MRRVSPLLLACLLFETPASAQPPSPTTTPTESVTPSPEWPRRLLLDQALDLFHQRGFDLLLAEASVQGAQADVLTAGASPNPALSVSLGKSFTCTDGRCAGVGALPWNVGLSDQAALEDTLSGKRGLRLEVARAALAATQANRADTERQLTSSVKQAFLGVIVAQRALSFTQQVRDATARTVELMAVRYHAGAVSEADLARVQTANLEAEQSVDSAEASLAQSRVVLAQWLGLRGPLPEFEAVGDELLHYGLPPALSSTSVEALASEALAHRPDVRAALAQTERARSSLVLARRSRIPDMTLSAQYAQQGTTPDAVTPPTFSVGLSAPLPLLYQQQGEVRHAESDVRAAELSQLRVEAQVRADTASAWAAFLSSQAQVQRMEGGLLERAQRARELVSVQYDKGAASLLEFLDAQRTDTSTHLEYLQDVQAYWSAVFRLEQAIGKELR